MTRPRNKSLDEAIKDLALTCVSATWVNMRRNKLFNAYLKRMQYRWGDAKARLRDAETEWRYDHEFRTFRLDVRRHLNSPWEV